MILIAIICPGLSFLLRGKLLSAIAAFILQVLAIILSIFGIGFFMWAGLAFWAISSYNQSRDDRRNRELIQAIRSKQERR